MTTSFQKFLQDRANNSLYDNAADEAHDGIWYLTAGAELFFPLAAKALIEDGIDRKLIARFLVQAAHEALGEGDPAKAAMADDELMRIASETRLTDETTQ